MGNECYNNKVKAYFIKMDEMKGIFHDAICQGEDRQVFELALQISLPTKAQRLIFSLLKIEYHWKGKIEILEKPIEPEENAEQEDEET